MEEIKKKKVRKTEEELSIDEPRGEEKEIFEEENIETFDYNKVVSPPVPKSKIGYPIVMITKTVIIYRIGENSNSSISKELGEKSIIGDKIYL